MIGAHYRQTRIENVPSDIMGFDAVTLGATASFDTAQGGKGLRYISARVPTGR